MTDVERAAFAAALSQCDVAAVDHCPAGTPASHESVMLRHDHRAQSAERHMLTRPVLHTTESRQQVPPCVQQ